MFFRLFILIAFYGILFPVSAFAGQSDALREEVSAMTKDLRSVQAREANLIGKQKTLSAEIREIKTSASGGFFQDLVLKRKLRGLRDLLNESVKLEKREEDLRDRLAEKRDALREEIREDILGGLNRDEKSSGQTQPDERIARYREVDALLREYAALSGTAEGSNPDLHNLKKIPEDIGNDPPGLREIAKTLTGHTRVLEREIQNLEGEKKNFSKEVSLQKGLGRFQGVLERTDAGISPSTNPEGTRNRIDKGERKVKQLEERVGDLRELEKAVQKRVKSLEGEADRIERGKKGKKR